MSRICFASSRSLTRDCSAPLPIVMAPKTTLTADLGWGDMVFVYYELQALWWCSTVWRLKGTSMKVLID